jgi:RNA ligase (TIGR02306 family)
MNVVFVPMMKTVTYSGTVDQNVQEALGITKWEPHLTSIIGGETERDPGFMPVFTDIESLRKYEHCLRMDEEVVATEKIHGSNARFVHHEDRLWVGSHYQFKREDDRNIYWKVARQRDLATKLATIPDIALYGEVYGHQKGFDYGLKPGEVDVSFFDAYDVSSGKYYDYHDFRDLIEKLDLPFAPILHLGVWDPTVKDLRFGNTLFNGKHIREGFVVRPIKERYEHVGRAVFKMISEEYHLRNSKE